NLSPPGAGHTEAFAADGNKQAGFSNFGFDHAGMWSGSAATWVDLAPPNTNDSRALGISGQQVGGYVTLRSDLTQHASLWTGSAASWVDLRPPGASGSLVNAVGGGQQAGAAGIGGISRAVLWTGT